MAAELSWEFVVPDVWDKTSHEAQWAVTDFLKMADKTFAEVSEKDN